ncbi:alpha/beta hydrolase [Gilvimarinus agarilyticus]|uniref:alpha/beta fold hydrolase n=1 Tax=unclassified Gilvimarinus TaxID=2642066 RepID=UPI001C08C67B|nr:MULTISPECIES: alpha/beta hydrolase [unclassified Gilvimarinus]MBU2885065.1 alpha/beta hydrolase [Gilvimarinus agarilyticus]MDO6569962.1 alpha/beta hydrolase [Gilvimarinus sp. 2_MG-2023]MDO6747228.1 alpha/beta hydrolase [Gilvimarinus sp. 1_MG-2023]
MSSDADALTLEVDGLHVAAQCWGEPDAAPVLALHGWLDNSASFCRLAPRLQGVRVVALDMAGHGQTAHRPGSAPYNIWEDVAEVMAVVDQLGWTSFSLLGHSRGAIVSSLVAAAFPERIDRLALIEGIFPEPVASVDAPHQLRNSIIESRKLANKPLRLFSDLEAAVKARINGMFPLSDRAARALTERGVQPVDGGYRWSTDQRLLAPSSFKFTRGQIDGFIRAIESPTRVILAEEGMPKLYPGYKEAVQGYSHLELFELPGGHHLHLEDQVDDVAKLVNEFFT